MCRAETGTSSLEPQQEESSSSKLGINSKASCGVIISHGRTPSIRFLTRQTKCNRRDAGFWEGQRPSAIQLYKEDLYFKLEHPILQ